MKKKLITSLLALSAIPAHAVTTLTVPNTSFSSGTAISSSAMNSNFSTIQSFINGSVCLNDGTNCAYTGTVTNVAAGMGLLGGPITGSGTLQVDVGTTSGKIVQLNGSAQLPAVNGMLLTNLNASNIVTGTVQIANGGTGSTSAASARAALGVPWNISGVDINYTAGKVAIGTSVSTSLFHVQTPTNGTVATFKAATTGTGSGAAIDFQNANANPRIARILPMGDPSVGGELQLQTSSDGLSWATGLTIKKDGKIGIGTIAPNNLMQIHANGSTGVASAAFTHYTNTNTNASGTDGLIVGYTDNVAKIWNNESTNISFGIGGTEQMFIDINGDLNAIGVLNTISDVRLKKDFAPIKDIFGKLNQIHAYYYKLKKDTQDRTYVGVKAQEVEKSFPEVVKQRKDGFKAVAYSQLVPPVIDAVNLLHKRVSALEPSARTPASEDRMKKLETENAQLKAWICAKDATAPFCK